MDIFSEFGIWGLLIVLSLFIVLIIIALATGREVQLWPPKIGPKNNNESGNQKGSKKLNENWLSIQDKKNTIDPSKEILKVEENLTVNQREKEIEDSNKYLQIALSAKIIALTYKTLGSALSRLHFENLEELVVCVYSLPNLSTTHPTLHSNFPGLNLEWTEGVQKTIEYFMDARNCPKLTHFDIIIFSGVPFMTGTKVNYELDGGRLSRLRFTFVNTGIEPEDNPTFVLNGQYQNSSFNTFNKIFDGIGGKIPAPLTFALKRPNYERKHIREFINELKQICNHPKMCCKDRFFEVELRNNIHSQKDEIESINPYHASQIIEFQGENSEPVLKWVGKSNKLTISHKFDDEPSIYHVSKKHILASFGILLFDNSVILVDYPKGSWQYDVPGGKVSVKDTDEYVTLKREVFEELGLLIDRHRISDPLGFFYDPFSSRENKSPVIAQYFVYHLDEDEYKDLIKTVQKCTKGYPLIKFPLKQLIKQKTENEGNIENLCHIPVSILEKIELN